MSILNKIKTGRTPRAQKVVIYAPEGFGKSTMASLFPAPLFLDVEDSTSQMEVNRLTREELPDLRSFEAALAAVAKERPCQTLIVDTIDWLEEMAVLAVIEADDKKYGAKNIEEVGGGFGKGYNFLTSRMNVVLAQLDRVIDAGIHVVLLAHASVVRFDPPDGAGAFDRYELKLFKDRKGGKGTASIVKEWADLVLFGNWRTQVAEKGRGDATTYKGIGGRDRILNCNRCAAWDAKNRHGMKDVEKWDIAVIEEAFRSVGAPWGNASVSAPPAQDAASRPPANITDVGGNGAIQPRGLVQPDTAPGKLAAGAAATGPTDTTGRVPSVSAATNVESPPANAPASPSELPRSADPIPGIEQPEKDDAELAKLIGSQEKLVNAWLIKNRHVTPDQTYRSCPADIRKRMLKNWDGFMKVATSLFGREGIAA